MVDEVDEVDSVDGQGRWDGCANDCRLEGVKVRPRFICNWQIMGGFFQISGKSVTLWKNRNSGGRQNFVFGKISFPDDFQRPEEPGRRCDHNPVNIGDLRLSPLSLATASRAALHDLAKKCYSPGE